MKTTIMQSSNLARLWALALLVLMAAIAQLPAVAADESAGTAHENYRVLNWADLVPEGWEPPLVPKAYDEVSGGAVDKTAVVSDLDEKLAALPGYMKPVVFEGNEVSELDDIFDGAEFTYSVV